MRENLKCPKCQGRTFYAVEKARMSDGHSSNGTTALAVAAEYVGTGEQGFLGERSERVEAHVDAWVCASCGFTELYVRELATLAELHTKNAEGVTLVDGVPGSDGAFR